MKTPPLGGGLSASPTVGAAFTGAFSAATAGWRLLDGAILGRAVPPPAALASALLGSLPLPSVYVASLLRLFYGSRFADEARVIGSTSPCATASDEVAWARLGAVAGAGARLSQLAMCNAGAAG
jgi:hypothetical protein